MERITERGYMFASVLSAVITGLEVCPIHVEADVSDGLPSFTMVGYPSVQVREAQDRVRTALKNRGIRIPPKRVTINFAPADIRKEGAGFDLPIAAAVLAAAGILEPQCLEGMMLMGELGLDGETHEIPGILPRVIKAKEMGCRGCILPYENLREGRLISEIQIIAVKNLQEMIYYLKYPHEYREELTEYQKRTEEVLDFSDVLGQESARRAAEIAVSGFHNILLLGGPGCGKSMIAKRIPTIMPELTEEEGLELTRIYSIAGALSKEHPLMRRRPFRSPHQMSTPQALLGGGKNPHPGEITMAHRGVLFLDELPEFSRNTLETLRQPLEENVVRISRVRGTYEFPADFLLAAAMNPCPCGYYPDMNRCRCSTGEISRYLGKISQPLLDRIDLCVEVSGVEYHDLQNSERGESSEDIRKRVDRVHRLQKERYESLGITFNSQLDHKNIERFCIMNEKSKKLLERAFSKRNFSARAYHRILKVARTIADMGESEMIQEVHMAEALMYRAFDKKYWN